MGSGTLAGPKLRVDWDVVMRSREFWIWYFRQSDNRVFHGGRSRVEATKAVDAIGELMIGHSVVIPCSPFSLELEIALERKLFIRELVGRRHLLGWSGVNSCNHVFQFSEIQQIAQSCEAIEYHHAFLVLLGFWGIPSGKAADARRATTAIRQCLRLTKLFSKTEIDAFTTPFETTMKRGGACEWKTEKRATVCVSSRSLRSRSPEMVEGRGKFNFALFSRFLELLK